MAVVNRIDPGVVANNIATLQFSAGAAPQLLVSQRDLRLRVFIKNTSVISGEIIYIGPDDTVTSATGYPIEPGQIHEVRTTAEIYVVTSFSGAVTVATLEEFVTTG